MHIIALVTLTGCLIITRAEPPSPNFSNIIQQSYGSPQDQGQPQRQREEEGLSGPTVECQNGRLMSTASGMNVIQTCMNKYKGNMKCVEYCYAESAMRALCPNGEIDFDKYIDFVAPNFPANVVQEVTRQWSWCIIQYGKLIDKSDKAYTGIDMYSQCLFRSFSTPC